MSECPFCDDSDAIVHSELSHVNFDNYPVSMGHALVMPRRHVTRFADLMLSELNDIMLSARITQGLIDDLYHPDGYTIGFNDGQAAGQTVDHVHLHVIPRYEYDVMDPAGGIRCVIPSRKRYQ